MTHGKHGDSWLPRKWIQLLGFMVVLPVGGCTDTDPLPAAATVNSAPLPTTDTNSSVVPPLSAASETPATHRNGGNGLDAAAPQATPAAPSPTTMYTPAHIRLSAGVALPQTLPEGTTVMCSMDYEWTEGGPRQECEYAWVIELGNGTRVAGPAKVSKRRGTIQAILHGIKPDQGPFKGAVFIKSPGGNAEPISDFVSLK